MLVVPPLPPLRKVLMGTSPEEVAQWRAERRAKWPSKDVVAAKQVGPIPSPTPSPTP